MTSPRALVIGTRGSQLALRQTDLAVAALRAAHPERSFVIERIRTTGDIQRDVPLAVIGGQGAFVKEIEAALSRGDIDLAVHSLKDVPTELGAGLVIAACLEREDPRDVLIARDGLRLDELPPGAVVGTGSARREAQLRAYRPDLEVRPIRGNVDTRLAKVEHGEADAVVLAAAGLRRLGWESRITEYLSPEMCLPAIGQAAVALEARADDAEILAVVRAIDHAETHLAVRAERAMLRALGGGCAVPVAAWAQVKNGRLVVTGMVASSDGRRILRAAVEGAAEVPENVGMALAEKLLAAGARSLLEEETS